MSCKKTTSNRKKCSSMQKQSDASNLQEFVKTYQSNYNLHERWNKKCSFEEAVFGAKPDKTDPHQKYFPKVRLHEIANLLAKQWNSSAFNDFEDLYDYVCSILYKSKTNPDGNIKTPNSLIFYDIALRLSAQYNVWPEKYVYLNGNGPSDGAKALGLEKFKYKNKRIAYSVITAQYPDLADLDAAEIEDFLCVCKKELFILKNNKS